MDKTEIKYNRIKDKLNFKGKTKVEDPILALKAEIEEFRAAATANKTKYVVPGKFRSRSHEISNLIKTPPNNENP